LEAEIRLIYGNEREAEAVTKAVSPDNVEVPPGLTVKTVRERTEVLTKVKCQTRLQTFIATLDDLLSCVSVAEKSFTIAKKFKTRRNILES
jgi:hypothetical protein